MSKDVIKLKNKRRFGFTTGSLLCILGDAMFNPGKKIIWHDHTFGEGHNNSEINDRCFSLLQEIIDKLGLKDIEIKNLGRDGISIISKWEGVYEGDDGHVYKRVF